MKKRLVMRCGQYSRRGRFVGKTSSFPRSYGTAIIVQSGSRPKPPKAVARRASLEAPRSVPDHQKSKRCLTDKTVAFAFRPGDEQDPRDERGQVIYDPGVTLGETWQALERLVDDGRCKAIGLSDVTLEKLREIVAVARIKPAVVQVESHPYLPEWDPLDFCREHGIVRLAFAALGHNLSPKLVDDHVITTIAQRVHKTPAQVALAWAVQRGTAFPTTSITPRRIQENFEISSLPDDAMRQIRDGITTKVRSMRWWGRACLASFPPSVDLNSDGQAICRERPPRLLFPSGRATARLVSIRRTSSLTRVRSAISAVRN